MQTFIIVYTVVVVDDGYEWEVKQLELMMFSIDVDLHGDLVSSGCEWILMGNIHQNL